MNTQPFMSTVYATGTLPGVLSGNCSIERTRSSSAFGPWAVQRTKEEVLKDFTFSKKEVFRESCHSAAVGARKVSKKGLTAGAITGAVAGLITGVVAGIGFPPSILAISVSTAIGALTGAVIGGVVGGLGGAIYHGAKTALSLTLQSPEKRLRSQAASGREKLDILEKRQANSLEPLRPDELKELENLQEKVKLWEGLVKELEALEAYPIQTV